MKGKPKIWLGMIILFLSQDGVPVKHCKSFVNQYGMLVSKNNRELNKTSGSTKNKEGSKKSKKPPFSICPLKERARQNPETELQRAEVLLQDIKNWTKTVSKYKNETAEELAIDVDEAINKLNTHNGPSRGSYLHAEGILKIWSQDETRLWNELGEKIMDLCVSHNIYNAMEPLFANQDIMVLDASEDDLKMQCINLKNTLEKSEKNLKKAEKRITSTRKKREDRQKKFEDVGDYRE